MASPTTLTAAETLAASATVSVLGLHGACDPPHRRPAPAHQPAPHEPVSAPVDAAFHIGGPAQLRSESGRAADNEFFKLAEKEHRLTKMMEKEARAEQEDGDDDVLNDVLNIAEGLLSETPRSVDAGRQQQQAQQVLQLQPALQPEPQPPPPSQLQPPPQRSEAKRKRRVPVSDGGTAPSGAAAATAVPASRAVAIARPLPSPSDSRSRMKARLTQRANGAAEPSSPSISDLAQWAAVYASNGTTNSSNDTTNSASHPTPAQVGALTSPITVQRRLPSSLQSRLRPTALPPADPAAAADLMMNHMSPTACSTPTTPGTPSSLNGPGTGDRRDYVKARLEHRQWRLSLGQTAVPDDEMLTVDQRRMRTALKHRFAKRASAKGLVTSPAPATPRTDGSVGSFGATPRLEQATTGSFVAPCVPAEAVNGKDASLPLAQPLQQPATARSASLIDVLSKLASHHNSGLASDGVGGIAAENGPAVEHTPSLVNLLRLLEVCYENDDGENPGKDGNGRKPSERIALLRHVSSLGLARDVTDGVRGGMEATAGSENQPNGTVHPPVAAADPAVRCKPTTAELSELSKPDGIDTQDRLRQLSRLMFYLGVAQGKGLLDQSEISNVMAQLMDESAPPLTQGPLMLLLERLCGDDASAPVAAPTEEGSTKADEDAPLHANGTDTQRLPPDKAGELPVNGA